MATTKHLDLSAIEEEIGLAERRCRALEEQLAIVRDLQSRAPSKEGKRQRMLKRKSSIRVAVRPAISNSSNVLPFAGRRSQPRRSYEQPTLSSTLKSNWKFSYFEPMIPFVAGQSTNKTHHLGLKMQETLSLLRRIRRERSLISPDAFLNKYMAGTSSEKINAIAPAPRRLTKRISRKVCSKPRLKMPTSSGKIAEKVPSVAELEDEFFDLERQFNEVRQAMRPSNLSVEIERRFRDVGLTLFCKKDLTPRDAHFVKMMMQQIRDELREVRSDPLFRASSSRHLIPPPPTPIKYK